MNYGAGVRYSQKVNDKVTPFGQLILGGAHISASDNGGSGCEKCNAFMLDIDGGVIDSGERSVGRAGRDRLSARGSSAPILTSAAG